MKTKFLTPIAVLFTITVIMVSCNTDNNYLEPAGDANPPADITLNFITETEEDQITGFANNAMIEFNGSVWIVGGYNDYTPPLFTNNSDIWASDNGVNWYSVTSGLFTPREGHSLSIIDDTLFMIGGIDNSAMGLEEIWSSLDGITWVLETASPPFGEAYHHTVTLFNGRHYLINGSQVWSSVNGLDWTLNTNNAFPSRNYHKTVVFNNELFVIGGLVDGSAVNDIWKSTDGITWEQIVPLGTVFSPRSAHGVAVYNNKIFVLAGRDGVTHYKDLYYTEDGTNWAEYPVTSPDPGIYGFGLLPYNDELWFFGGYRGTEASSEITSIHEL